MEFNRINPFMEEREDFRSAQITSMLHNVNTIDEGKLKSPKDFMLRSMDEIVEEEIEEKKRADEEASISPEDQQHAWHMFIDQLTMDRKPQQTEFKG